MEAHAQDTARDLDPFGFMVGHGSAIRSLGGKERSPDPRYVFHTPYVEFQPGRVLFTIRFDQLKASFGELRVNINAFIPGSGRDAIFVTSARLQMADSAAVARGLSISFLSVAGATYAAFGYCVEGTDAQAAGISIHAEQLEANDEAGQQPLLPTHFTGVDLQIPTRLVSEDAVSFTDPASQPMTEAQFAEPGFELWASRLSPRPASPDAQWRLAFIAQVLDRYGMLRSGAQGIGWGEESRALAPIFAAAQCDAVLAAPPVEPAGIAIAWNALACSALDAVPGPDGSFPGKIVSLVEQPADQRGFDFLWSIGMAEQGHAAGSSVNLLCELMAVLRPGGYAVHMFDLAAGDAGAGLPRREVERLSVMLISRGFSVAQLHFGAMGAQGDIPFGLVVRKD
ncbi:MULTISPECIES: hypothetical protein [unclassified Sphingomonas]|uniref:hypothetical protein n=1 Tax=unclassified Sphingomonas TaxID=196159 RepID=UPI0006F62C5D|nr:MULTISPECIES: hypothetical protein [unclassified Sphingomonas]KQX17846.1 hypothetical protein ASD17_19270 [Sphingomonas sp. Root1294]KQY70772.1 hypothetical protein ASD39_23170 [Sphingomonas sp. Root50]KRB91735.1 hypothetical protein ASE22_07140 [Sphingomonas sp. Root720]